MFKSVQEKILKEWASSELSPVAMETPGPASWAAFGAGSLTCYKRVGHLSDRQEWMKSSIYYGQYCGSVTFWYGSGPAGPRIRASAFAVFVIDLKEAKKKSKFSAYYFLKVHLHDFSKIKSHKEVAKQ
jgi:hypothetical protein